MKGSADGRSRDRLNGRSEGGFDEEVLRADRRAGLSEGQIAGKRACRDGRQRTTDEGEVED